MITLEMDQLHFRIPEVHEDAHFRANFQRTLRVPDANETFPLPPGLGTFPLRHIEDFSGRLPEKWTKRGGILFPMHQAEAMWINFNRSDYPFAVKIGTGKINAVSGKPWSAELNTDPQDYLVVPGQPWLDGYAAAEGVVRQFVAMPLGSGKTVEHHFTGTEEHGGLQILAYPMKRNRYLQLIEERQRLKQAVDMPLARHAPVAARMAPMGLAAGGHIRQEVYKDPYGIDAWDQTQARRCFVTIINSETWTQLTDEPFPTQPVSAADYAKAGLPWFDHYDDKLKPTSGASAFLELPPLSRGEKVTQWFRGNKELPVVDVGPKQRPAAPPRRVTEGPL